MLPVWVPRPSLLADLTRPHRPYACQTVDKLHLRTLGWPPSLHTPLPPMTQVKQSGMRLVLAQSLRDMPLGPQGKVCPLGRVLSQTDKLACRQVVQNLSLASLNMARHVQTGQGLLLADCSRVKTAVHHPLPGRLTLKDAPRRAATGGNSLRKQQRRHAMPGAVPGTRVLALMEEGLPKHLRGACRAPPQDSSLHLLRSSAMSRLVVQGGPLHHRMGHAKLRHSVATCVA
jgi:hypothetical protein